MTGTQGNLEVTDISLSWSQWRQFNRHIQKTNQILLFKCFDILCASIKIRLTNKSRKHSSKLKSMQTAL